MLLNVEQFVNIDAAVSARHRPGGEQFLSESLAFPSFLGGAVFWQESTRVSTPGLVSPGWRRDVTAPSSPATERG
jgi:hypothetical protein